MCLFFIIKSFMLFTPAPQTRTMKIVSKPLYNRLTVVRQRPRTPDLRGFSFGPQRDSVGSESTQRWSKVRSGQKDPVTPGT